MDAVIRMLFFVCPWLALFFFVRLACAPFNAKIAGQIRRHPIQHAIWGCFALVGVGLVFWLMNPGIWPPDFVKRRMFREKVLARVQTAGGWAAVKKECDELVKGNRPFDYWLVRQTNGLPAALAGLQAWEIEVVPVQWEVAEGTRRTNVVRIKMSRPRASYYGLEVIPEEWANGGYLPNLKYSHGGLEKYRSYREVTNGVFEIY